MGMMPQLRAQGHNFPSSCIGILADLWMKDGISQRDLGISLIKTKSSITKMLAALEKAGLIIKELDKNDKRKHLIFLTKEGKELRSHVEQSSQDLEKELLSDLSKDEVAITKKVLTKYYKKLSSKLLNKHIND